MESAGLKTASVKSVLKSVKSVATLPFHGKTFGNKRLPCRNTPLLPLGRPPSGRLVRHVVVEDTPVVGEARAGTGARENRPGSAGGRWHADCFLDGWWQAGGAAGQNGGRAMVRKKPRSAKGDAAEQGTGAEPGRVATGGAPAVLTLHSPGLAGHYRARGVWRGETLYACLAGQALLRPDGFALRDAHRRLTWAQLLLWVDSVADDLRAGGVRPGQRVSVWLPSRVEAVVVFLACSRNGYVCNPSLHPNHTVAEVTALLDRIQGTVLFAQTGYGADAEACDIFAAARNLPSMKRVYRLEPYGERWSCADHPFPAMEPSRPILDAPRTDADKIVYLAFTSGTSGTPKGVMHSDDTLLANGRAMVEDWGHGAGTVVLSLSPMSHHIGTVALEQALVAGCELVLNDPPPGMHALDWLGATGANYVMGVPTHAIDILAELRRRGGGALGAVRVFYMAGATIPPETARAFLALGVTPQNVYGMTENGSHHYTRPQDDPDTLVSTCGRPSRGYEVRVWKQHDPDTEAAPGEIGEIGGRGGTLMLGYFNDQIATENAFNRDGWFMSGDLGLIDESGNLRVVGRCKDLIIRGGRNIHPLPIEEAAMEHPQVRIAAGIPIPDDRLGEKLCLVLSVAEPAPSGSELLRHLRRRGLSKYDLPEYLALCQDFPLTASGKVLKRGLVDLWQRGQLTPIPVPRLSEPARRKGA